MRIGVVIPARDEEAMIGRTLGLLRRRGDAAVTVVADCDSADATRRIAEDAGAVVVTGRSLRNRAIAMEAGAQCAREHVADLDALWFLHADSIAAEAWDEAIAEALADRRVVGGAFDFRWDLRGMPFTKRKLLRFIGEYNRIRFRITKTYFGDQGIFVRPHALDAIGGVPNATLMEDVLICRRLKREGALRLARGKTTTSPRRFVRHGVLRQVMLDMMLLSAERLGMEPTRLHEWYNREKA